MEIKDLSELEEELYNLLTEKGVLTIPEIQEINPRMVGALGKLKSKGYAKVERDFQEKDKSRRKKIYPMLPDATETKEETEEVVTEQKDTTEIEKPVPEEEKKE